MLKLLVFFIFLGAIMQSCQQKPGKDEASTPVKDVFASYYEERLALFPLEATMNGDNRYNDKMSDDLTQAGKLKAETFFKKYQSELAKYDREKLTEEEKTSWDLLQWECNINLEGLKFPTELMPLNQIFSTHLMIGQMASGGSLQPFKTVKDYENWLKRVDGFVVWCDTAVVNMRRGMKEGYILPKPLIKKMIPQLADMDHGPVKEHLFYSPAKNFPEEFSDDEKARFEKEYAAMVEGKIIPTFKKLHNFVEKEYLPAGRSTHGFDALPNGKALYDYYIKYFTTTEMNADQIHQIGINEVARISGEMEKVKEQVGYKGDLKSFFNAVREDKKLMPFTNPEEVIVHFNKIHETMKPNLQKLFELTPKTKFEVRRTEAFREASAAAEYNPGLADGSRPGVFYVPVPDVKKYNVVSDESLFLHEAIPGHHYQISLQQENKSLPDFRKNLWYSAYGEGWALYSESLGKELGLYTDPYQYFGMLSGEMHRAIRLVVDTGLHSKGWTREQAIQYSLDHEAESEESIIAEIERYMAGGGQALSYKIGQLKIRELRTKAEKELGSKFDIKDFHKLVLESGCVPLKLLEDKTNAWIGAKK
ncbi:DUF885 domain-containing protein [Dyadobacter chenwenxiniae]|uniref:DUF885 domain-containing protein n=1 Tax=Dyadobacter chenwenxiniae TaxID=2906456 RepID=A0A9X1PJV1_9BACT|nr:DUF885 domain-containing protein [Dyadobacter chenwenxiniae]MCF0062243.1 DUF885 domain-containing protein [Dyadobacter chenwenxiniae]UON84001.1 DUF885 domain-containing protein [Dyadobacter chenwenxiniae]